MTDLGIFARVFPPGAPDDVAQAVRAAGFGVTQLNLSVLRRPTLDTSLTAADAQAIGAAFEAAGVRVWGLSGTFNAIDPDEERRRRSIAACRAVISRAPDIGAQVVTLCTGTRDPGDMWRAHPENTTPTAWREMRATLDELLPAAAAAGVRLGIEPEAGNVVRDAASAARLLDEVGSDRRLLAIVLDPANLLSVQTLPDQRAVLEHAFAALGNDVAAMHAKDVVASGYSAPGAGGMDYDLVMRLHGTLPHDGPVIAQDVEADDAARVYAFLREHAGDA